MHPIHILPTCLALLAAVFVVLAARRRQRGLIGTIIGSGLTGVVVWYLTLFASVLAIWYAQGGA